MKVFIIGASGFIGSSLVETILNQKDWEVFGIDREDEKITPFLKHPRLHFFKGDITIDSPIVDQFIRESDVVILLAAISRPLVYITDPLQVFEIDFEANFAILKKVFQHHKRLLFASSSEVYGMCDDAEFDEEASRFVLGPVDKTRWIYAACKQFMERMIYIYGQKGLSFTLFRFFNCIGPNLDNINVKERGGSRVLPQFIGNILRGEDICLVDGGEQRRCFTDIDDSTDCLIRIIENKAGSAENRIFNIGNPANSFSIRELAALLVDTMKTYPAWTDLAEKTKLMTVDGEDYYGKGYQDMTNRVPSIRNARRFLNWEPQTPFQVTLRKILDSLSSRVA